MAFLVKLTCRGTAKRTHPLRTVAQFRYDDGWARVHGEHDAIVQETTSDLRLRHRFECDRCSRREVFTTDKLYPLLDEAREYGSAQVPIG